MHDASQVWYDRALQHPNDLAPHDLASLENMMAQVNEHSSGVICGSVSFIFIGLLAAHFMQLGSRGHATVLSNRSRT